MTWHCLALLTPYDPVTDQRLPVRAASASLREITGLGGWPWDPAMVEAPQTSIALFGGGFNQPIAAGSMRLALTLGAMRKRYAYADRVYWPGASVTLYIGRAGDPWPWVKHFVGKVTGHGRDKDVVALSCEVDAEPFNKDVLSRTYAGTGDAEGGADLAGKPKPLVLGWAQNVAPVLINATDSVYQFSGYGPIEAVDHLYERASDFGAKTADYADYAALVAATVPRGRWATCLAEGLVRLGAPEAGVITGDVRGHKVGATTPRRTGAFISALADIAGVDADLIDTATLDAMDAAAPYDVNLVLTEQAQFIDMAQRLALPCNRQAGIGLAGKLFVTSIAVTGDPLFVLHAGGKRVPQVVESKELTVSPPVAQVMFGANRSWRVHTMDEIAFDADIVPKGAYDNAATYRYGDLVSSPDQSEWLYINATPGSGHAPPAWPTTSNAYWTNTKPPVGADDIEYSTGDTLEDLRPAEQLADVTSEIPTVADSVIACDYTGTAKAGQLPRVVPFSLTRNGTPVTASATWSVTVLSGSATVPTDVDISNAGGTEGRLTITNAPSDMVIEITADYGSGLAVRTAQHKVTRQLDAPPSSGGGGSGTSGSAYGSVNGGITGTTPGAIGDELEVVVGSGGNVDLNAYGTWASDQPSGSQQAYAQWYHWNGAAYVALGSENLAETFLPSFGLPVNWGVSYADTGRTPGATEKYRVYGRAGGSYTASFSGDCSAVSS